MSDELLRGDEEDRLVAELLREARLFRSPSTLELGSPVLRSIAADLEIAAERLRLWPKKWQATLDTYSDLVGEQVRRAEAAEAQVATLRVEVANERRRRLAAEDERDAEHARQSEGETQ